MENQYYALTKLPYVERLSTTINSKRNIFPTTGPTAIPAVKYLGMGIKGYYNLDAQTGSEPYEPRASNMDLYLPLPFRVVPENEDLDPVTRELYRMRTVETIDGQRFVFYWLKVATYPTGTISLTQTDLSGKEIAYTPNPANLSPTPVKAATDPVSNGTLNTGRVSVKCQCEITGAEVLEAFNILYNGNLSTAKVSEFGFYSGEDKVVTAKDHLNQDFTYTEAMYTQLASHRCTTGFDFRTTDAKMIESITWSNGNLLIANA